MTPLLTLPEAAERLEPLSVTIPGAMRLTGLGRNSIYNLMNAGKVQHFKMCGRTLIVYASIKALMPEPLPVPINVAKRNYRKRVQTVEDGTSS